MRLELPTPLELQEADRLAVEQGPVDFYGLMLRAGGAVADVVLERLAAARHVDVLCGPGNNGGDGYVVARLLAERGVPVTVWAMAAPRVGSDAARAAADCPIEPRALADFHCSGDRLVIDALFGAGLSRPLDGDVARVAGLVASGGVPVVSVDVPSGLSGRSGVASGPVFGADLTVTFVRRKPGHLLLPGRQLCGEVVVADIGISDAVIEEIGVATFENLPQLWQHEWPPLSVDTHKYRRGHVGVFSGGPVSTGAARLSAMAAARVGAGAVTLLSPEAALGANAAHLTSIILREQNSLSDAMAFMHERQPRALVFGPGIGLAPSVGDFALEIVDGLSGFDTAIVFDADAITGFAARPEAFFAAVAAASLRAFLTPHHGEFGRLFPDLAGNEDLSKLDRARQAASRSGCTVIYKGPDTVIASPDGRAAINSNGTPLLATAGSGDVLAGLIAGLSAQGMPDFEAACAAVWIHAEAATAFGPGLIAEDLPHAVVPVLQRLHGWSDASQ